MDHTEKEPVYHPRRKKIKNGTLGWVSFCLMSLAVLVIGFVVVKALLAFLNMHAGSSDISSVTLGSMISAVLALGGFLVAIVTLFLPRQKKGLAIFSAVLSLIVCLVSGAVVYYYNYMFGSISHDSEFETLDKQELHVVQPSEDGSIRLDAQPQVETISREEVERQLALQQLEWEYLLDTDIPEGAQKIMNSKTPLTPCYMRDGADQIQNYLLFGLDAQGSSDVIMILSMDRYHKKIKLISLARDSYVMIPEWGTYTKLTYAYNAGGAKTAVRTVNYNYILNIEDYITVDFDGIKEIVDLAGGVDVELDSDEIRYLNRKGHYGLSVGMNHLDGDAALIYARIRSSSKNDSEAKRTGRQREVLTSLFNSAKAMSLSDYPELIRACMEICTTSFESSELLGMVIEAVTKGYTLETHALIDMVDYWGGQFGPANYFYVVYDLDGASNVLYRLIYEDRYVSGYLNEKKD